MEASGGKCSTHGFRVAFGLQPDRVHRRSRQYRPSPKSSAPHRPQRPGLALRIGWSHPEARRSPCGLRRSAKQHRPCLSRVRQLRRWAFRTAGRRCVAGTKNVAWAELVLRVNILCDSDLRRHRHQLNRHRLRPRSTAAWAGSATASSATKTATRWFGALSSASTCLVHRAIPRCSRPSLRELPAHSAAA